MKIKKISTTVFFLLLSVSFFSYANYDKVLGKIARVDDELITPFYNNELAIPKKTSNEENIDSFSGSLTLSHVDIDIPGNFDIPVRIKRTASSGGFSARGFNLFGNFESNLPIVYFTEPMDFYTYSTPIVYTPWKSKYCNELINYTFPPGSDPSNPTGFYSSLIGSKLIIRADGKDRILFRKDKNNTKFPNEAIWITKDNWYITCERGGEGLIAHNPNGIKYHFERFNLKGLAINDVEYLAKKVEDRYGNWVKYDYNFPERSKEASIKIYSSDDRIIDIKLRSINGSGLKVRRVKSKDRSYVSVQLSHLA